jgi:hypothetical protein
MPIARPSSMFLSFKNGLGDVLRSNPKSVDRSIAQKLPEPPWGRAESIAMAALATSFLAFLISAFNIWLARRTDQRAVRKEKRREAEEAAKRANSARVNATAEHHEMGNMRADDRSTSRDHSEVVNVTPTIKGP